MNKLCAVIQYIEVYIRDRAGNEIGHFDVNDLEDYNSTKFKLGISTTVQDETHINKGFSRLIIAAMILQLDKEGVSNSNLCYIGADSSSGFWRHIGMKDNPRYEPAAPTYNPHHPENGYELVISIRGLSEFAIRQALSTSGGKRKSKRNKRKTKKKRYVRM